MNKSEILNALEWVDQTARDGDAARLVKAKQALESALSSAKDSGGPEQAYKIAQESFVRKHGREPLEELGTED
ncbi:MAG: hypothetical protein NTY51_13655 [Deltaproteobacteria bacterium]|nr:hypothetical protein [Deltaproteobacteria bacterium]